MAPRPSLHLLHLRFACGRTGRRSDLQKRGRGLPPGLRVAVAARFGRMVGGSSTFFFWLIGTMMPLQFCDFSDVPLQFSYLQPCHYNSLSTWLMPFSAAAATSGPPAGRRTHTILPYGRLCPSPTRIEPVDSVALTPWLSLARLAFPLPTNPNPRS